MKRISIFLIVVALVAGMIGCDGGVKYILTMAVNPAGNGTATDLSSSSPYAAGTEVSIQAVANAGYEFAGWTAPAGAFADADAAETTFTMPAQNATVTANFAPISRYTLTMAADPAAGGTAIDAANGSPYAAGTLVSIEAEASTGYEFVGWTAAAGTLTDANAEETSFTMPAQDVTVTANFFEGQLIHTWHDLDDIRATLGGDYLLMNGLDSTTAGYEELASPTANEGEGWQPIGTSSAKFTGSFDGQGYNIGDLFIDPEGFGDTSEIGLFGCVGEGGVVKDIGVVDADVSGIWQVGGLVGENLGTVNNSYFTGTVTGNDRVGCLVGKNEGSVSNSYSTGSVSAFSGVGGLVGHNYGTVSDSYCTGNVHGVTVVGGLVGDNAGAVSDSYATGSVDNGAHIGGLVGINDGTVSNSYSTGSVSGFEEFGGLVGVNNGAVTNSFWDTETSGQATSDGGTGKTTEEMQDIATFSLAGWNIISVADPGTRDVAYVWNIVNNVTYPFLSWQA